MAPIDSIELAPFILGAAFERAKAIEDENRKAARPAVQGESPYGTESFLRRVSGYAAESAVASFLGLDPVRTGDHFQQKPDVGGYDVMATKHKDGCLIFTPKNPLWSVKVLVIDESPWFHLAGCYACSDAREHPEWWREPRPNGGAWFVPQSVLRPIGSAEDVRPIAERQKQNLEAFSADWRTMLKRAGVEPPKASPFANAVKKP